MGARNEVHEVRCSASQAVFRKHACATPVLDACYTRVPAAGGTTSAFIILEAQMATLHTHSGAAHAIALPCRPRALWPMMPGVVLEGEPALAATAGMLPPLFLLRRPLDSPIPLAAADTAGGIGFGRVLVASRQLSLLLTHDAATQRHALWKIGGGVLAEGGGGDGPAKEAPPVLHPVWAQSPGSAPTAASTAFFSSAAASGVLYLQQEESSFLSLHDILGCELAPPSAAPLAAAAPLAVLPAASAQPVSCSFGGLAEDVLLLLSRQPPAPELQLWLAGRHGTLCLTRCSTASVAPRAPPTRATAPVVSRLTKCATPPAPPMPDRVRLALQVVTSGYDSEA